MKDPGKLMLIASSDNARHDIDGVRKEVLLKGSDDKRVHDMVEDLLNRGETLYYLYVQDKIMSASA